MTAPDRSLRLGLVLHTSEEVCRVAVDDQSLDVPYARAFPTPRAERVRPGHLVALASVHAGSELVVWRWFDAVVLDVAAAGVTVWEPGHGTVLASPRDPDAAYRPGARAYLSAGLPGAEWWLEGPAVDRAEDAVVDLDTVARFLADVGMWADPG